ncbi:MAG: LysM peptidoglycan-binding domain-containing protein [Thermoguttaceae bacterium]
MSKKDKRNKDFRRDSASNNEFDDHDYPDFNESDFAQTNLRENGFDEPDGMESSDDDADDEYIPRRSTSAISTSAPSKGATCSATQNSAKTPLVDDFDDECEEETLSKPSLIGRILSLPLSSCRTAARLSVAIFAGICGTIAKFVPQSFSSFRSIFSWSLQTGRNGVIKIGGAVKYVASFLVLKRSLTEDESEEHSEEAGTVETKKAVEAKQTDLPKANTIINQATPIQTVIASGASADSVSSEKSLKTASAASYIDDTDDDDFDGSVSKWSGIVYKSGVLAASLLLLSGGYFVARPFFSKSANTNEAVSISNEVVSNNDATTNNTIDLDDNSLQKNTDVASEISSKPALPTTDVEKPVLPKMEVEKPAPPKTDAKNLVDFPNPATSTISDPFDAGILAANSIDSSKNVDPFSTAETGDIFALPISPINDSNLTAAAPDLLANTPTTSTQFKTDGDSMSKVAAGAIGVVATAPANEVHLPASDNLNANLNGFTSFDAISVESVSASPVNSDNQAPVNPALVSQTQGIPSPVIPDPTISAQTIPNLAVSMSSPPSTSPQTTEVSSSDLDLIATNSFSPIVADTTSLPSLSTNEASTTISTLPALAALVPPPVNVIPLSAPTPTIPLSADTLVQSTSLPHLSVQSVPSEPEHGIAIPASPPSTVNSAPLMIPNGVASNTVVQSVPFNEPPAPPDINMPETQPIVAPIPPLIANLSSSSLAIPSSGNVVPGPPLPNLPTISESTLQIPDDPTHQIGASFTAPTTAPLPNTAMSAAMSPQVSSAEAALSSPQVFTSTLSNGLNSNGLTISQDSHQTIGSFTTTIPPVLPEHESIAKIDPPLGSKLQNQLQEWRNGDSSSPSLRFSPIPQDDLPPIHSAPPAVTATTFPQYGTENRVAEASQVVSDVTTEEYTSSERLSFDKKVATSAPANIPKITVGNAPIPLPDHPTNTSSGASSFQSNRDLVQNIPTTTKYTVQPGDTYMSISSQLFGNSSLFRALAEHNRSKYGIAYMPEPGTVIEVPTANYLQTTYSDAANVAGRRSGSHALLATRSTSLQPGVKYLVQEGDTLFRLATDKLRDTSRWRDIMAMNADQLNDPRDLRPGMEIILPVTDTAAIGTGASR